MTESQMIYGTFKEETKNRFLCQVTIDSKDVECYIPSSCRLGNFIDMKGRTVLLKHNQSKDARTEYAVYAVKIKNEIILLNLSQANRIIEEALHKRRFSFLGLRRQIVREKKIGGYKSDLYIEDTKTIIETKKPEKSRQKAAGCRNTQEVIYTQPLFITPFYLLKGYRSDRLDINIPVIPKAARRDGFTR